MSSDSIGLIVAAIDFGVSATAGAFALRDRPDTIVIVPPLSDLRDVRNVNSVMSSGGKVQSILLLDAVTMKAVAFGPTATHRYLTEGLDNEGHTNGVFLLLENFKMQLQGHELPENITAKCGRSVPLLTAITETFAVLRLSIMGHVRRSLPENQKLYENDFSWHISYPTLWESAATRLMLTAAQNAGMKRVTFVPESEAAAIKCRHDQLQSSKKMVSELDKAMQKLANLRLTDGEKVLVLDGGGGTFDVTAHTVMSNGRLGNVKWHGGPWGAQRVDASIERVLDRVFGAMFMFKYSKKFPADYEILRNSISIFKHTISDEKDFTGRLTLPESFLLATKLCDVNKSQLKRLKLNADPHGVRPSVATSDPPKSQPLSYAAAAAGATNLVTVDQKSNMMDKKQDQESNMMEIDKKLNELNLYSVPGCKMMNDDDLKSVEFIGYSSGALRFSGPLCQRLMMEVITPIMDHVKSLRDEKNPFVAVFAVGGFCESPLLRSELTKLFGNNTLRIPAFPMLAVLEGTVLFGLDPELITSRVMTRFYGTDQCLRWDSDNHKIIQGECTPDKKSHPNEWLCHNHFRTLVQRNATVAPTKRFIVRKIPMVRNQETMTVELYCTDREVSVLPERLGPKVRLLGKVHVNLRPLSIDQKIDICDVMNDPHGLDRKVNIEFQFGAQITVTASLAANGQRIPHTFDFPVDD